MSKVQKLVIISCVLVMLPACLHHVQARPGPTAFNMVQTTDEGGEPTHPSIIQLVEQNVDLRNVHSESELDSDEELDIVCKETGTCEQKRALTASIDYRNDGPNDPITDPPH